MSLSEPVLGAPVASVAASFVRFFGCDRASSRKGRDLLIVFTVSLSVLAACTGDQGSETTSPSGSRASGVESVTIGGVRLVPIPGPVQRECALLASHHTFPVACPGLAPRAIEGRDGWDVCLGAGCHFRSGIAGFVELFHGPPGYRGINDGIVGHMEIWAMTRTGPSVGCEGAPTGGTVPIDGVTGTWLLCPPGIMAAESGHVLLRWTKDGVTYGVSLHGHTALNRRLVYVIATHLTYT